MAEDAAGRARYVQVEIARAEGEIREAKRRLREFDERQSTIRERPQASKDADREFLLLNRAAMRTQAHIRAQESFIAEMRFLARVLLKFRNDEETFPEVCARDFPELLADLREGETIDEFVTRRFSVAPRD